MLENRVHSELAKRGIKLGVPLFTREGRDLPRGLGLEAVEQVLPVKDALDGQIAIRSRGLRRTSSDPVPVSSPPSLAGGTTSPFS